MAVVCQSKIRGRRVKGNRLIFPGVELNFPAAPSDFDRLISGCLLTLTPLLKGPFHYCNGASRGHADQWRSEFRLVDQEPAQVPLGLS